MKKNLFFYAAAAALMLTACTNEDDVVQVNQTVTTVENDGGVGFDVYLPGTTQSTRSGRTNIMTTSTLKITGFGVLGYWHDKATAANATYAEDLSGKTLKPDFMYNQQINFNSQSNGWYYSPLKYWPNETGKDAQTTPAEMPDWDGTLTNGAIDRLSFFAYAPWTRFFVSGTGEPDANANVPDPSSHKESATTVGITKITKQDGTFNGSTDPVDPKIHYVVATDPNNSVDLLWGTAPVGGLQYKAVNGEQISIKEGMPLVDLVKPAVNTNLKFLLHHALARLGVKIVLASDIVAAGGDFDFGNTKVTVEKIEIYGKTGHTFALEGDLNLNNTNANVAEWENVTEAVDGNRLVIDETHGLAPHLVYDATKNTAHQQQIVTGVVTELADAIKVSSTKDYDADYNGYTKMIETSALKYTPTTPFFDGYQENFTDAYKPFSSWTPDEYTVYFQMCKTNNILTDSRAFTVINPVITYPNAIVWENIYGITRSDVVKVTNANLSTYATSAYKTKTYRCIDKNIADGATVRTSYGATFYPTGQIPEIGDWVFLSTPTEVTAPTATDNKWTAVPNYFMVIPTNYINITEPAENRTLYVKIKYWVSTKDPSLENGILYVPNEVEKEIVLPSFKNGMAYNLKLILGMTSVKIEAEMEEWQTMTQEVNLPQNTSE